MSVGNQKKAATAPTVTASSSSSAVAAAAGGVACTAPGKGQNVEPTGRLDKRHSRAANALPMDIGDTPPSPSRGEGNSARVASASASRRTAAGARAQELAAAKFAGMRSAAEAKGPPVGHGAGDAAAGERVEASASSGEGKVVWRAKHFCRGGEGEGGGGATVVEAEASGYFLPYDNVPFRSCLSRARIDNSNCSIFCVSLVACLCPPSAGNTLAGADDMSPPIDGPIFYADSCPWVPFLSELVLLLMNSTDLLRGVHPPLPVANCANTPGSAQHFWSY